MCNDSMTTLIEHKGFDVNLSSVMPGEYAVCCFKQFDFLFLATVSAIDVVCIRRQFHVL